MADATAFGPAPGLRGGRASLPRELPRAPGWTRLRAEAKLLALIATVAAVVALPVAAPWAYAGLATMLVALHRAAGVPWRWLRGRAWIEAPFALYALALPFVSEDASARVLGLPWSWAGAALGAALLGKATLSLLAAAWLAATTPTAELLRGARGLGAPALLVSVAGFMLRYLDLVAEDLGRIRLAMAARGFRARGVAQWRPLAGALGHLFVRTFERGERVHQAMLARGYDGRPPPLPPPAAAAPPPLVAAVVPLCAWILTLSSRL